MCQNRRYCEVTVITIVQQLRLHAQCGSRTHCLEQETSKTFSLHVWANPHQADVDEWTMILHMVQTVRQTAAG